MAEFSKSLTLLLDVYLCHVVCLNLDQSVYIDVHSEPEFRLVFMLPAMVMCGLGMFLFGYTMEIGAAAELCAFLQGVMMVGVLIGIFATLAYALDAFRSQSNEMFIMNMFFKVRDPLL